jgi:hypothetical protein
MAVLSTCSSVVVRYLVEVQKRILNFQFSCWLLCRGSSTDDLEHIITKGMKQLGVEMLKLDTFNIPLHLGILLPFSWVQWSTLHSRKKKTITTIKCVMI